LGRKRIGKRKHVYGLLAGLIVLLVSGCSYVPIQNSVPEDTVREGNAKEEKLAERLQKAAELYGHGDFEGGLKANQAIMSLCGRKPPCDQALFNMGLIYASNNNAKRDYRKSMAMFQRVVREYPQSPLVPQAKTWIGVLDVIEKSKEVDMEIERAKKKLAR
jgi:outer membrane protein assembly factor BamD (BamD/ComL family)